MFNFALYFFNVSWYTMISQWKSGKLHGFFMHYTNLTAYNSQSNFVKERFYYVRVQTSQ